MTTEITTLDTPDQASIETADPGIRRTIAAYLARLAASDASGIVELYTSDGVLMAPDLPTAAGHDRLTAVYQDAFTHCTMTYTNEIDTILIDGDLASVASRSTGTVTATATGAATPLPCRELFVLRRVAGDWKIARYMFQHLTAQ